MNTMTTVYPMYKDKHMEKFERVIRHIKLISMNRRLFWMHLQLHKAVMGAVYVHHDQNVPHVQGLAHGEVQEG
jgi:hypothetical protein